MTDPKRSTPLDHRQPLSAPDGAVHMAQRHFQGKVILRANSDDVAKAKVDLPKATRFLQTAGAKILWLGPDEWMFIAPDGGQGDMRGTLSKALAGKHHQLVDVSDYYTAIRLSGDKAIEVLMKVSTLDLHPRGFTSGMVAGTVFGSANVWLIKNDDTPEFDVIIRWSMADYLWCMLAEAGREFGVPVQTPIAQNKGLRYKNT